MKRKLLLASALLFNSILLSAQSWVIQNTTFPAASTGIGDISSPAPGVAWITGYDGTGSAANIIDFSRTTDGGVTWTPGLVGSDTTYQFSNIFALDANTAWVAMFNQVVGTGGGIWKTIDGGVNWNQQDSGLIFDANSFPDMVYFWDADTGVAIGDPNNGYFEIYTTVNGGTDWTRTPSANIPAALGGAGEYGVIDHFDAYGNVIWFATDRGRVYKSVDKGLNWTVATVLALPSTQGMDIRFLDENNGLASIVTLATGLRPANSVRRTTDGGATWTIQAYTGNFFASDFGRVPGSGMFLATGALTTPAGNMGTSYSPDTGLTWIVIDTAVQHTAFGSYDINNTWTGGFNGFDVNFNNVEGIFKLDPGILGVKTPVCLRADLNSYPNPTTGIVTLNFKVGRNVDVKASLVNLIGEVVYSEKFLNVSLFSHTFNFSSLPKGIYILNVEYGSDRSSQKLVIQ